MSVTDQETGVVLAIIETYFGCCSGCKAKLPLDPKQSYLLPCLHTSCQECFTGNISVCDCSIHAFSLDEVAPNLMILEVAVLQEKKCASCAGNKSKAARWYCEGCSCEICGECYDAHEQLACMKDHPRVFIEDRAVVDSTLMSMTKCSTHPNQRIQALCCGVLVCLQCTGVDGAHHSHLNQHIGKVTQATLSQLEIWIEDSQQNILLIRRCLDMSEVTVASMRADEERFAGQVSEALINIEPNLSREMLLLIQQQFTRRRDEIEVKHQKLKFRLESTERMVAFMKVLCHSQLHIHAVQAFNFLKICLSRNLEPINLVPILDVTPPVEVDRCLAQLGRLNRMLHDCMQAFSKYKPATIIAGIPESPSLPSRCSDFSIAYPATPSSSYSCDVLEDPLRPPGSVPEHNVDAQDGAYPDPDVNSVAQSLLELAHQPRRKSSCSDRSSMAATPPSIAVDSAVLNSLKRSQNSTPEGTIFTPNWDHVGLASGAFELLNSGLVDERGWFVPRCSEVKSNDLMAVKNELVYCKVLITENGNLPISDHPCRSHSQNLNPTSTRTGNIVTLARDTTGSTEDTALPIQASNSDRGPPSYPNDSDVAVGEPFVSPIPESLNAGGLFDVVNTGGNSSIGVDDNGVFKVHRVSTPFRKLAAIAKEAAKSIRVGVDRNGTPSSVVSEESSGTTLSQTSREEKKSIRNDSKLGMDLRRLEDTSSFVETVNTLESISGTALEFPEDPVHVAVCPNLGFSDRVSLASSSPFEGFLSTTIYVDNIDYLDKDAHDGSNSHAVPVQEDVGSEAPPVKRKRGRPKKCIAEGGAKPASQRKRKWRK